MASAPPETSLIVDVDLAASATAAPLTTTVRGLDRAALVMLDDGGARALVSSALGAVVMAECLRRLGYAAEPVRTRGKLAPA
jgi:hypothetical protein